MVKHQAKACASGFRGTRATPLLAGTALTTILIGFSVPENAACTVSTSGAVDCATTTTTNTTNLNGANNPSSDRAQVFTGIDGIDAIIQPGAVVNGFGLWLRQQTASETFEIQV